MPELVSDDETSDDGAGSDRGSVADSAAVEAALGAAVGGFGRLDVLVNCAAKMDGHALLETSEDECATPLCCCNWISGSALAA